MRTRQVSKRFTTGGIVAFAAVLVVILIVTQAGAINTADARAHISSTGVGTSSSTTHASWFKAMPSLSGSVLHWTQLLSFSEINTPDPANGRVLVGDIWEVIGPNGVPTAYHARYTYRDGMLHQEIFQTQTAILIVFGRDYAKTMAQIPGWCIQRGTSSASSMAANFPLFADETALAEAGATAQTTRTIEPLPLASPQTGIQPRAEYPSGSMVQTWTITTSDTRAYTTQTVQLELGLGGRVQVRHIHLTDGRGTVIEDSWTANGSLFVYDPASVRASMYTMPQQVLGGCDQ